MTAFLRLLDDSVDEKPDALRKAVAALHDLEKHDPSFKARIFERDPKVFAKVPGSPFAYWVSEELAGIFARLSQFEAQGRTAKHGAATLDDTRFLRLATEAPIGSKAWVPFAKGGAHSPFYSDLHLVLRWHREGDEVKAFVAMKVGSASRTIQATEYYFRPGLTWPRRTNGLSFRAMPAGCIFADKGSAAFVGDDEHSLLLAMCALMNSLPFGYLVAAQLARTELAQSYEVGIIQQTPVPALSAADVGPLADLTLQAWSIRRAIDSSVETSHAFTLPLEANERVSGLSMATSERQLAQIDLVVHERAFQLYGISAEGRSAIEVASRGQWSSPLSGEHEQGDDEAEPDYAPIDVPVLPLRSWLVGLAFGRFDPRLATGERPIPPEPEPFDPLPTRSPGMWPENEPRDVLPPAILADDPGHDRDLTAHVARAAAIVSVPIPDDLRPWLARDFFPLHIKMYSKSRRKAPIYWQLATPSASYSVWLYLHAFTKDTLYQVQNDYVVPKVAHEQSKLESLRRELGEGAKSAGRKTIAAQEAFVEELRGMLDEVKRIAPLWNPDLDDGVIINFAPLYRLVPHHKPWQKELRSTWDSLCAGEYDWAHLAMHLWPERVVPKCATDRSLAIAHGLEDVFWLSGADGKWKPRKAPTTPLEDLIAERTSAAVKAALSSLLGVSTAQGKARAKKGR